MKRIFVRMGRVGMAIGLAAAFGCDSEPVAPELPSDELQAVLDDLVATDLATAVLARVQDGDAEWVGSAGVSDLESQEPADPDGHFRIGSVTKTFTAIVILQLVDEGRLDLDDTVEQHLPGMVPGGEEITIRQLLNHTSGLPSAPAPPPGSRTPEEFVENVFATNDPSFAPGTGWEYSNPAYVVLGLLIEQLTGNPYGQEVTDRIVQPLGLAGTVVPGTDPTIPDPHAHGYVSMPAAEGQEPRLEDVTEFAPLVLFSAGEMNLHHRRPQPLLRRAARRRPAQRGVAGSDA